MKYKTLEKHMNKLDAKTWANNELSLQFQQGYASAIKDMKAFHCSLSTVMFHRVERDCKEMMYHTSHVVPQTDREKGFMYALSDILRFITVDHKDEYMTFMLERAI